MAQGTQTTLQKGQTIPDFTLNDLDGNPVSSRSFYMRRNLVIATLPQTLDDRWRKWVNQLSEAVTEIPDGDAAVLVMVSEDHPPIEHSSSITFLSDPERRLGARFGASDDDGLLVITDRYGVIFRSASGKPQDTELDPASVPGWVEFIVCQCS